MLIAAHSGNRTHAPEDKDSFFDPHGAARNDSLNPRVFLRCAGKRWRQEREDDPTACHEVIANAFVFRNLTITRYPS